MEHKMNIRNHHPRRTAHMLLRQIERFLRKTDMPCTKFGRLAARDPRFVADLRNGRIPRERTAARIETFMNTYLAGQQEGSHAY